MKFLYIMLSSPAELGKEIVKERWQIPLHLSLINLLLVKLAERRLYRFIVNLPPRHGKSELITKFFIFWYIGNFPSHRIFLVTYQNKFAEEWGRRLRQLITEYGKTYFDIELDPKESSARQLRINKYGGMIYCVGSCGPITGRGADLIVIDDPIKNDREALSPKIRDNLWDWFKATLYTRLEPDGILILVMTRWHTDDIVARIQNSFDLLEYGKDINKIQDIELTMNKWLLLRLTAIAEENDPLGRRIGEPLWQSRFPIDLLMERKQVLGEFWFSALYQQTPKPLTGKIFRREKFNYFSIKDDFIEFLTKKEEQILLSYIKLSDLSIFATIDLAITTNQQSDFTVAVVFGISKDRKIFLLEVLREKFDSAEHINFVHNIFSKWHPILIGIESVQYQVSLVQQARRLGIPIKELRPDKDKVARSLAIATYVENGLVYLNQRASWLEDFLAELVEFPNGKHDDQVDAFAYIAQIIQPITVGKVFGVTKKTSTRQINLFEETGFIL